MERWLAATKPGGISLFRQGLLLWDLLPRMRAGRLLALMTRFGELLHQHTLFTGILGVPYVRGPLRCNPVLHRPEPLEE